jgi:hypothetical protein
MGAKSRWTARHRTLLVVIAGVIAGAVVGLVGALALLFWPSGLAPQAAPAAEQAIVADSAAISADCATEAAPFLSQIQAKAREWDHVRQQVDSTSRASVEAGAAQIDELSAILDETKEVQAPTCAAGIKQPLIATMEATQEGFRAVFNQQPDDDVKDLFALASEQHRLFDEAVQHLQAGNPVPAAAQGLGVQLAAIQGAFPTHSFHQVGGDDAYVGAGSGGGLDDYNIWLIGPAENLQSANISVLVQGGNTQQYDAMKQSLSTFLRVAAPDWANGSAWLATVMQKEKNSRHMIVYRGRLIICEREDLEDSTITLIIRTL